MREHQLNEDVATEPIISRVDDASGIFCSREKLFKRNFVLQKLVAVQKFIKIWAQAFWKLCIDFV